MGSYLNTLTNKHSKISVINFGESYLFDVDLGSRKFVLNVFIYIKKNDHNGLSTSQKVPKTKYKFKSNTMRLLKNLGAISIYW